MKKECIASIMVKKDLGKDNFIYYCHHVEIGEIDEETQSFIDEKGRKYLPMFSGESLEAKSAYAYHNLVYLEEIKGTVPDDVPFGAVLVEFEKICQNYFYFVGKKDDGQVFCAVLNREDFKNKAQNVNKSNEQANNVLEKESTIEYDEDGKPMYRYGDNYTLDIELDQLLGEIEDGKYTTAELIKILNYLEDTMMEAETIISTIDKKTKGVANEKNVSTVNYDKLKYSGKGTKKININDLFKKVTKTLIAQDEPARRVIAEIARKEMDVRKKKEGILLTGPTGVGKTELMRLIAKHINRPFYKVDSTQLTMPGYVGKDIEEVLWDLYEKCGKDLSLAERAIIFFDEVDKKGSDKKSDPSGQGVLNVLLPFIEGSTYTACPNTKFPSESVQISTDNMTVILGGAFSDVYKNVVKKDLGFLKTDEPISQNHLASTSDFVERGMMTNEFMSRVTVVKLNDLDVEAIKRVMLESDESAIRIQQEIFKKMGVKLTFTDGYTTTVAQNAINKKTGARGLNGIIDESTWKAFEEVYSNPKTYSEVILDEETVYNPEHYQLVKKMKSKGKNM